MDVPVGRSGARSPRRALVLPGRTYTPALPLLQRTRRVLEDHDWSVREVWWQVPSSLEGINRWVTEHVVKISQSPNVEGEKVGALNAAFSWLYELHLASRKLKNWNRTVYYAAKYAVIALVLGGLVISAVS